MRVTYYGQACTLVEVAGRKIVTDPWLTEGAFFGTWFHTHLLADAGVTPETFPLDVDYIYVSHEHEDHLDAESLRHFPPDIPVLICKFQTPKFRRYLERLGLRNIHELDSGVAMSLGDGLSVTALCTAEYTNDSAVVIEGEGCRLLNETDCKLSFHQYERLGQLGIDIGFYMFSGANWYPMMYDYPPEQQRELVRRRRRSLSRSLVQRVTATRPRFAVPAAGPCMVLDPDMLWLNSPERGIFIDPEEAVAALQAAQAPTEPLYMRVTDVWDSQNHFQTRAPRLLHQPRQQYIRDAAERMTTQIRRFKQSEAPAKGDLSERLVSYFNETIGAQTDTVRKRVGAKLALCVSGPQGGCWTADFTASGPQYVREGLAPDWTYKIDVEDKLLYPFLSGKMPFFEDILLSMRVRVARRPDDYNEPLYHFLYEPDPRKMHDWYATH